MLKLTRLLAPIVCATMVVAGVPREASAQESQEESSAEETSDNESTQESRADEPEDETEDETASDTSDYDKMSEQELRDERTNHETYRSLGFGLIGLGVVLTGLGAFGIARGVTACNRVDPCTSQTATGVLLGLLSTSSGLSGVGGGIAVVIWSNNELKKIDRKLSFGLAPRPNGAAATLNFRF